MIIIIGMYIRRYDGPTAVKKAIKRNPRFSVSTGEFTADHSTYTRTRSLTLSPSFSRPSTHRDSMFPETCCFFVYVASFSFSGIGWQSNRGGGGILAFSFFFFLSQLPLLFWNFLGEINLINYGRERRRRRLPRPRVRARVAKIDRRALGRYPIHHHYQSSFPCGTGFMLFFLYNHHELLLGYSLITFLVWSHAVLIVEATLMWCERRASDAMRSSDFARYIIRT